MIFSKSCEYALRAVLYTYMKSDSNANLGVKEIAKEIGSPVPFTAKILQQLTKKKIISSVKGPNGGFYIDPSSKPVSIYQVVEAIDGTDFFERCVIGLKRCSEANPCPLHVHFVGHRNEIKELFKKKTIYDLIVNHEGKINLK
ncbi:MAG: Rrf2 family transcriptional regulator [Sphingobacteriales bacterium]|nr:Rrf2 family transcriptional regulator [Sphingobacteriales bacterium]